LKGDLIVALDISNQYDSIYRFCYLRVRNTALAEDITQETFLRFLEHPQYQTVSKTMQLLYTIAGNLCKDEFRKNRTTELPEDLPSDEDTEDSVVTSLSLRQALAELPDDDRELMLLRYANDVPIGVISKILGISRFKVSRRLTRITQELRDKLGKEELE
jgi:RNA polymerase sigma-70 factor (ECF subfamily)